MKNLKKSYMTLLETLIAVSILSIVLVFVFGFFREMNEITRLTDLQQKESFQNRYLESRLNYIFERIVNENEKNIHRLFFYTEPPNRSYWLSTSLVLTFDNGVRSNPMFSGDVLAKLYLDTERRLKLAIWPLHVEDPHLYMHEEILLENVADLNFSFYRAPERIQDNKEIHSGEVIDAENKFPKKNTWHPDWYITYNQMPSIIKISIDVAKNPKELSGYRPGMPIDKINTTYHFVLPSSNNPVQYPPPKD